MTDPYAFGAHSDEVRALQQALAARGLYADALDGIFGPHTKAAVDAARSKFGLPPGGADNALLLNLGLMPRPALPASVRLALTLLLPAPGAEGDDDRELRPGTAASRRRCLVFGILCA